MMRTVATGVAWALLLAAVPLQAEVLDIRWGAPAPAAEVATMTGLAVDRFDGPDGAQLAAALERRLAETRDGRGQVYYDLFALSAPNAAGNVEAVIDGAAGATIEERRNQQRRRYCRDSDRPRTDCDDKEKEEREVTCRTRTVSFTSDVRIARESDGRVIYRRSVPGREEATWCPAQSAPGSSEEVVSRLIANAANAYVADLAPNWQRGPVRVLEDRKGLTKEQGERFKAALRATKTSGAEACRLFDALAAEAPAQRSLAFNRALCAEMRGEHQAALDGYRGMGGDRDAAAAAARVRATMDAMALEAERG